MNTLYENVKSFFSKKDKGEPVGESPLGFCSVCWATNGWEDLYYDFQNDNTDGEDSAVYNDFVNNIVHKHEETTSLVNDEYVCNICNITVK